MGYDEFEMKSNEKFIVQGENSLQGEITPSGNKNEALPVLAAVLLTEEPVISVSYTHLTLPTNREV